MPVSVSMNVTEASDAERRSTQPRLHIYTTGHKTNYSLKFNLQKCPIIFWKI